MNLKNWARRALVVVAVATSVTAAGQAQADSIVPTRAQNTGTVLAAAVVATAPRSPTATPGNATVKLAWLAPSSNGGATINKYRVQRATSKSGPWKTIATPTVRRHRAGGLTNGTRYYFRIAAHNAAGWSSPSKVVTAVPRTVPTVPRSAKVTPGNTAVKLAWLAPSSNGGAKINTYRVQRATSASGPWKTVAKPTTRSYTAGGLTNGKRYYFRVAAHNGAGWSTPSNVVSGVPRTVPTAPLSLTASPGTEMVALSWSEPSSNGGATIDRYRVQQGTNGGPWASIADPTTLGHDAKGLTTANTYSFRIRAHNAAGWSAPSTVVQAVPYGVPRMPLNPSATVVNDQLTITWSTPTYDGGKPVTKYYIYAAVSANGPYTHVGTAVPPSLKYVYNVHPVDLGTTVYYRIVAENAFGIGPPNQITVKIPAKVPGAPATCKAVQLGGSGSDTARITWNPPTSDGGNPILFYQLKIWDEHGPLVMDTSLWNGTTYDASPLLPVYPWERYDVKIAAYNKVGPGPMCETSVNMWNT
jgi:titin